MNHELILVAHSTRPVDLDGVSEDFVRFNDQRKDDFGLQTVDNAKLLTLAMCLWLCYSVNVLNVMNLMVVT